MHGLSAERQEALAEAARKQKLHAKGCYKNDTKKFEFANQLDQLVTIWVSTINDCWQATKLLPYQDSGILRPRDGGYNLYLHKGWSFCI